MGSVGDGMGEDGRGGTLNEVGGREAGRWWRSHWSRARGSRRGGALGDEREGVERREGGCASAEVVLLRHDVG